MGEWDGLIGLAKGVAAWMLMYYMLKSLWVIPAAYSNFKQRRLERLARRRKHPVR